MTSEFLTRLTTWSQAQPGNFALRLTALLIVCLLLVAVSRRQLARLRFRLALAGLVAALLLPLACWLAPRWPLLPALPAPHPTASDQTPLRQLDGLGDALRQDAWAPNREAPALAVGTADAAERGAFAAPPTSVAGRRDGETAPDAVRGGSVAPPALLENPPLVTGRPPSAARESTPLRSDLLAAIPGWVLVWGGCSLLLLMRFILGGHSRSAAHFKMDRARCR
jgi:hypothetical protein